LILYVASSLICSKSQAVQDTQRESTISVHKMGNGEDNPKNALRGIPISGRTTPIKMASNHSPPSGWPPSQRRPAWYGYSHLHRSGNKKCTNGLRMSTRGLKKRAVETDGRKESYPASPKKNDYHCDYSTFFGAL
jgi:hypothetical protein